MTTRVEKSVTVDAPVSVVYNTWTQFEDFPLFMGGVQEVRQLSDTHLHWVAEIAGVKREWDAIILEQVPDQKVAWAATEGATNAGTVEFAPAGAESTEVTLTLEYEPEGLVEKAGDFLSIVERRAEADMENFKNLIATGGRDAGGWRGSVNPGVDVQPGVESEEESSGISGKAVAAGVAAAAVAAAGVAATKSGSSDTEVETTTPVVPEVETTPAPVVETTVQPVETEPVAVETDVVVVEEPAPFADETDSDTTATQTYPVADDPTPFREDRTEGGTGRT